MSRMLAFACAAILASCPGTRTGAETHVGVRWIVETVIRTSSGDDVDDAEPRVLFVGDERDAFVVRLGGAAGVCGTSPDDDLGAVCGARPSNLVTRLVCSRDPHVDRVYCFDATRTDEGLVLSRRVFEVPSVDGPAPPPRLVESAEVAKVDLAPSCDVVVQRTFGRYVVDDHD